MQQAPAARLPQDSSEQYLYEMYETPAELLSALSYAVKTNIKLRNKADKQMRELIHLEYMLHEVAGSDGSGRCYSCDWLYWEDDLTACSCQDKMFCHICREKEGRRPDALHSMETCYTDAEAARP
jgi:hypothetical protein